MRKRLPPILVFMLAAAVYLMGGLAPIERALTHLRFDLLERDATGGLVLVEIDARSLGELDSRPWPRRQHAVLVDRLRLAGADDIALDIDFSSHATDPADDALFAAALTRADGRVVLGVLGQRAAHGAGPGARIQTGPIPVIRDRVRLASVNLRPDRDGLVRGYATKDAWQGAIVDSLPRLLAGGATGAPATTFEIDYGIQPGSIPRLSYVDVLRGDFDAAAVAGKKVIVGATAIELGDQVAVPVFGALPGPVVQAMAYESLTQGRALRHAPRLVVLAGALLLALTLLPYFARWPWRIGLGVTALVLVLAAASAVVAQMALPVLLDTTLWMLLTVLGYGAGLAGRIDSQDLRLLTQRLELRRQDALMRRVVENTFDAIIITDGAGRIRSVNRAVEAIFKWRAADIVGCPLSNLLADDKEYLVSAVLSDPLPQRLARGRQPFEATGIRRDGAKIEIDLSIRRMDAETESGHAAGKGSTYIVVARDVTDRKQSQALAEQARQRLRDAIDSISEAFVLYDSDDRVVLYNERFLEFHRGLETGIEAGWRFEDIIRSQAYFGAIPEADGRVEEWVGERVARHRHPTGPFEQRMVDGRWLRISERRSLDGGIVGILSDVTEVKEREQVLSDSKNEAVLASRAKSEFLANMSHELRTPLNAIIGFSEILNSELFGPVGSPQYKEYAADINNCGSHLLGIINDILDVSKIEAGRFPLDETKVDLVEAVEGCFRIVGGRIEALGLCLENGLRGNLPRLVADDRVLRQTLINLLSNAIKFTPAGGHVRVQAGLTDELGLFISVSDTGVGIPKADLPKVTEAFYQVDGSTQRKFEGTGLGLHLSAMFMELHGGKLEIDSELGIGTTVTLLFPPERVTFEDNVIHLARA